LDQVYLIQEFMQVEVEVVVVVDKLQDQEELVEEVQVEDQV
jgi:hypothetical protein